MQRFSFVQVSDLHLGYSQYGLESRREDFNRVFQEVVEKTINVKPDFMIIAGDLFHHARPTNATLENAIKNFRRLRDAEIPVVAVDGSHDSAPNAITGTILHPLDSAGLINYLPRHEGACWRKPDCCYVYGVPNFRTRRKTEELLPAFLEQNTPIPDPTLFNIFVFHMALDLSSLKPPYIEAEAPPEIIPEGFNYYAGGHLHFPYKGKFKTGLLAYSGCTENTNYEEAKNTKGFFYINVDEKKEILQEFIELESPRRFVVLEEDFTGVDPSKITEMSVHLVKEADAEGVIVVPVLKGVLPAEANRAQVNLAQIRKAARKAMHVHPQILLREHELPEDVVRSIFESEFKDLKTKAFEYFLQIFVERYASSEAEKIANIAVSLIDPLTKKQEEKVKQTFEELLE